MYFARISNNPPAPAKRPKHWATSEDQVEVFSQLCSIAADTSSATLTTSKGSLVGVAGWPNTENMRPTFAPIESEEAPPSSGEPVQVVAENKRIRFEYQTTFLGVDELGRWILEVPQVITSSDRRSIPRYQPRGWKVVLRRAGDQGEDIRARVDDISVGGLAIVVPQESFRLRRERPLVGVLLGPTGERLPLRATVCHYKPWERSELPKLLIGSSFDGFGMVNHARLARILANRRT